MECLFPPLTTIPTRIWKYSSRIPRIPHEFGTRTSTHAERNHVVHVAGNRNTHRCGRGHIRAHAHASAHAHVHVQYTCTHTHTHTCTHTRTHCHTHTHTHTHMHTHTHTHTHVCTRTLVHYHVFTMLRILSLCASGTLSL